MTRCCSMRLSRAMLILYKLIQAKWSEMGIFSQQEATTPQQKVSREERSCRACQHRWRLHIHGRGSGGIG